MKNILKISGAAFVILILFAGSWVSINWNHWQSEKASEEAKTYGEQGKALQRWGKVLEDARKESKVKYFEKLEEFRDKRPNLYEKVMDETKRQKYKEFEDQDFEKSEVNKAKRLKIEEFMDQREMFFFGMPKTKVEDLLEKKEYSIKERTNYETHGEETLVYEDNRGEEGISASLYFTPNSKELFGIQVNSKNKLPIYENIKSIFLKKYGRHKNKTEGPYLQSYSWLANGVEIKLNVNTLDVTDAHIEALKTDVSARYTSKELHAKAKDQWEGNIEVKSKANDNENSKVSKKTLEIVANEAVWFSLVKDGKSKEHFLRPDEKIKIQFDDELRLKLGNAGGVSLKYNNEKYPLNANPGEVKEVSFPD